MYIVKAYVDSLNKKDWLPILDDGWWEKDTLEEAMAIREEVLTKYPLLLNVKIFKSEEVTIEDGLRNSSIERKKAEYDLLLQLRAKGYEGIVDNKEFDDILNKKLFLEEWDNV